MKKNLYLYIFLTIIFTDIFTGNEIIPFNNSSSIYSIFEKAPKEKSFNNLPKEYFFKKNNSKSQLNKTLNSPVKFEKLKNKIKFKKNKEKASFEFSRILKKIHVYRFPFSKKKK